MGTFSIIAVTYLAVRTVLAWRDPPWLRWEYVFPIMDVILVSMVVWLRQDPNSVLVYAYFLPIAEAVGTLNVRWAALIGLLSMIGATAATYQMEGVMGLASSFRLAASFRLVFLLLMASLLTWLARLAAELQADLKAADDRNRIAMEMHDGVQAQLIAIASQLEMARCVALKDGAQASQIASDCRNLARGAADDLRFLVHRLRAPQPSEAFQPALQQYVHNLSTRTGLPITVQVSGTSYPLGPDIEHALFRIAQESLNNTLKHAEASDARVTLEYNPDRMRLEIRDNGRGLVPKTGPQDDGMHNGLEGMRERAERCGGRLEIESAAGQGTAVIAVIPRKAINTRTGKEAKSDQSQLAIGGKT